MKFHPSIVFAIGALLVSSVAHPFLASAADFWSLPVGDELSRPTDDFGRDIGTLTDDLDRDVKSYIVTFKDSVPDIVQLLVEAKKSLGVRPSLLYSRTLKGFSAPLDDKQLTALENDPRIASVAEDREVHILYQAVPTGVERIGARGITGSGGEGVGIAILDTGVQLNHPDLQANISIGKSCVAGATSPNDDNGHGTHVAGIIAAHNNAIGVVGVAPKSHIIPVKVLNRRGSGTWSTVICGIDWITANASRLGIKVVNMSLGGVGTSDNNCGKKNNDPLHAAICRSRDAGLTYVVAAGNEQTDIRQTIPAAYDDAVITVSALADSDGKPGGEGDFTFYGMDDEFAFFSNYGTGVDFGAPGVDIVSTWISGTYRMLSGTSMASPHVAGAAAMYAQTHPTSTWTTIRDGLKNSAESLDHGHTDLFGRHPEPIVRIP